MLQKRPKLQTSHARIMIQSLSWSNNLRTRINFWHKSYVKLTSIYRACVLYEERLTYLYSVLSQHILKEVHNNTMVRACHLCHEVIHESPQVHESEEPKDEIKASEIKGIWVIGNFRRKKHLIESCIQRIWSKRFYNETWFWVKTLSKQIKTLITRVKRYTVCRMRIQIYVND